MKGFISRAIALFVLLSNLLWGIFPTRTLSAAPVPETGAYACILSDDVFFYATADERRGLFLLPKTYFVKLIEYGTPYSKIEYQQDGEHTRRLVGYVRTERLTFVNFIPKTPYLQKIFDVRYRIDDEEIQDDSFLTQITVTCAYYGDYTVGSNTYCYVLRDGTFGYIPCPNDFSYAENTEYQEYLDQLAAATPPPTQTETENQTFSPVQIAILIVLCLLVPILAALILKPPKRPPYELEDDYA